MNNGVGIDTPLQVKVKNYMRKHICPKCLSHHKGQACIYCANSDEYMCDNVPLEFKIMLNNE